MLPLKDIPDVNAETMIPHKRMRLSTFARMTWTLMALIVVSVTWLIISKFDLDRLRGADHFVDKAREAVAQKDWPAALSAIRRVDGKMRGEPEFLRIMADYLIGTRSEPTTLAQFLEKLHTAGMSKPDDHLWLARAYLTEGRPTQARVALDRVAADQRDTLVYLDFKVALLRSEGRMREAVEAENILFNRFEQDPGIAVRKAARDLTGTFPEIQQAAVQHLWNAAENADEYSVAAIRILSSYAGLTKLQASRLQQLADKHADLTVNDRLNIASVMMRLDPEHREAVLQAEIERSQAAGTGTFQALIAWLAREREFGKILRLVPRESLIQSVELFPAVAQDLAQRQQWTDLMGLIEKGKPLPVSNARAASWRALATRNLQPADTRAARAHLEEAIAEGLAKNDRQALAAAIALAEEWNMLDLALDAVLKLALPDAPNEAELLEKGWNLASKLKREEIMATVVERLIKLKPGNALLTRRRDYLRLLQGDAIELTLEQKISEWDDGELLLQALKSYRMGDWTLAATTLEKIRRTTDMSTGETAVYAGLLAKMCGAVSLAYNLAEKIRQDLLLPEEKNFLHMAL